MTDKSVQDVDQPEESGPAGAGAALSIPTWLSVTVAVVLVAVLFVFGLTGYVEKWLWMSQLNYAQIFWTVLSVQCAMGVATFVVVFAFLWFNLHQAVTAGADSLAAVSPWRSALKDADSDANAAAFVKMFPVALKSAFGLVSGVVALLFAVSLFAQWDTYLRFRYGGKFGVADPLYNVDVGFYVFHLPFYEMLQRGLLALLLCALAIVVVNYMFVGALSATRRPDAAIDGRAVAHISVLSALLAADLGWGFYLGRFELLYSTMGVVYGAGFTAANVTQWALWGMIGLSAAAFAFAVVNVFWRRIFGFGTAVGAYVLAWLAGIYFVPMVFQKFVVQPSELAMERPYLANYIAATRSAFQLDAVKETSYPALEDLTPAVMARNQDTIQNIRLWDSRPLLQTYAQTQAIRLYYKFSEVATDRYHLADGYHQVMLSPRELSNELPAAAQTWVNQNLQFTHGYGLVMNFVSKNIGGFPEYLLENVPTQSNFGLKIDQPAIYYGESMNGYRLVDTDIKEFDYPKGNDNVYTSYAGNGGIPLDSFWKRILFAWNKGDVNILFTTYLKPASRIQIHRNVRERVAEIAPFLRLDSDPYPVLSAGKLYWIQDAYTGSSYFPYSNPQSTEPFVAPTSANSAFGPDGLGARFSGPDSTPVALAPPLDGLNYVRNSVKVVVDMYDGDVSFYIMDPSDPVLAAYRRAFPGVFKPLDQLSPDLKTHLRYPEDIFGVQANQYKTFHMTDPHVFYNREDLWAAPTETYSGEMQRMEPYYILAKLPGSTNLEYMLMTPFTPHNRDNMISWMAARSDFPDYGRMLFYELPKDKLIYGPNQIEAMINQNTTISQQLTLWNQNGSRVIRGKQIVTPIENSFLYVVPLYLTSAATDFPQLKRVIAIAGDRVVMEPTLDEALTALFGAHSAKRLGDAPQPAPIGSSAGPVNISQARGDLEDVEKAAGGGNWAEFGGAMEKLKGLLANPPVAARQ